MSQTTTTAVPQNDVDTLMHSIADEAGSVKIYVFCNLKFQHRQAKLIIKFLFR